VIKGYLRQDTRGQTANCTTTRQEDSKVVKNEASSRTSYKLYKYKLSHEYDFQNDDRE